MVYYYYIYLTITPQDRHLLSWPSSAKSDLLYPLSSCRIWISLPIPGSILATVVRIQYLVKDSLLKFIHFSFSNQELFLPVWEDSYTNRKPSHLLYLRFLQSVFSFFQWSHKVYRPQKWSCLRQQDYPYEYCLAI